MTIISVVTETKSVVMYVTASTLIQLTTKSTSFNDR